MPPVRSFSELELNANLASRLKLICAAQCEPVCSIDWYIAQRPIAERTQQAVNFIRPAESRPSLLNSFFSGGDSSVAPMSSFTFEAQREFPLDGLSGLTVIENLINRPNDTQFSWLRETSLSQFTTDSSSIQLNSASRQLAREAEQLLTSLGANVFSKLELTYHQLVQLLQRAQNDEILIKCKLNTTLSPRRAPRFNSKFSDSRDESLANKDKDNDYTIGFHHALIKPGNWWSPTSELDDRPFGSQSNLSELLSGVPNSVLDPETEIQQLQQPRLPRIRPTSDLHSSRLLSMGEQPSLSSPVDEMQISILLDRKFSPGPQLNTLLGVTHQYLIATFSLLIVFNFMFTFRATARR